MSTLSWICLLITSILLISTVPDSTGMLKRKQDYSLSYAIKHEQDVKRQYKQQKQTKELQKNNAKLDTLLKQLKIDAPNTKKK